MVLRFQIIINSVVRFEIYLSDTSSSDLLEGKVRILSNQDCSSLEYYNVKSAYDVKRLKVNRALPKGIADEIICAVGLDLDKDGSYSVRYLQIYFGAELYVLIILKFQIYRGLVKEIVVDL